MAKKVKRDFLAEIEALKDERDELRNDYEYKLEELGNEATELNNRISELEGLLDVTTTLNTMVGEVRYKTDNLLDAQVMEKFAEIMQTVQPATLLQQLETLKLL